MAANEVIEAVAALCDPTAVTIGSQAAHVPAKLEQLADALANSGEAGDGLRSFAHSVPPIDLGAFELWRSVDESARDWAAACDVDAGAVCAGLNRVGQVRALWHAAGDRVSGRGESEAARFVGDVRAWADRIENLLNPSKTVRRIWGAACPHCEASMTQAWVEDQRVRVPAIALIPEAEGRAAALVCGHCGWARRVPVPERV